MASYTEKQKTKLVNTICKEVAGGRSLRSVLRDENMPSNPTFSKWMKDSKQRLLQYTCAREDRADFIFEQILDISDSQEGDMITLEDGREVVNHDVIQRARLRVDSRKWMLGKMQPAKYGERLDVQSSDGSMSPNTGLEGKTFEELYQLKYGKKPE